MSLERTVMRWEQDPQGGAHGTMTLFFQNGDVSLQMPTFKAAHELSEAIRRELREVRYDARAGLLNEIGRIKP